MSEAKFEFGDRVQHSVHGLGVVIKDYNEANSITGPTLYDVVYPKTRIAAWESELTPYTPPPPPNTVPVRIAVAVGEDGSWYAAAECCESDEKGVEIAKEGINYMPHRITFITAHVPLPAEPAEVEGRVE